MNHHLTVLLTEAVDALNIQTDGTYIDVTLGAGGHSEEILKRLTSRHRFIGIDADSTAIEAFTQAGLPKTKASVELVCRNFKAINDVVTEKNCTNVRGILADLGWRMEQFSGSGKGFSFQIDEPLYMTYGDPSQYPFTAVDIVNDWAEEDIANVIYAYGEERQSRKIAKAIVEARQTKPIEKSMELADIIVSVVRKDRKSRIHPATKTFQALRIAVNDEFDVLDEFISSAFDLLVDKGRLIIISFHSLEDRVVKHRFRSLADGGHGVLITKKPIVAGPAELAENPRARSAKMRIIEKCIT